MFIGQSLWDESTCWHFDVYFTVPEVQTQLLSSSELESSILIVSTLFFVFLQLEDYNAHHSAIKSGFYQVIFRSNPAITDEFLPMTKTQSQEYVLAQKNMSELTPTRYFSC